MLDLQHLPFHAPPGQFQGQAEQLLAAHAAGDPAALQIFHEKHPRFLDPEVKWLPKRMADSEIMNASLDLSDAQLAVARWYDFRDWPALEAFASAVANDPFVRRFEIAAGAVVDGNVTALGALLLAHPELVRERSMRVTHFTPAVHQATLLHYVAANGVEQFRQRIPPQAVEIAKLLLRAGADPNALANMYGGKSTTLCMLVSSRHPAHARLQVPLIDALVDAGASVEAQGEGRWRSPLRTALAFGFLDAAVALIRRGGIVEDVAVAAGMGWPEETRRLLPGSNAESRHLALALAAQLGWTDVVRVLLDAGEDANRYNPEGSHAHSTPLHQAASGGHDAVVRLLVERGAELEQRDKIYHATPLEWADYNGRAAIAEYLRSRAPTDRLAFTLYKQ